MIVDVFHLYIYSKLMVVFVCWRWIASVFGACGLDSCRS